MPILPKGTPHLLLGKDCSEGLTQPDHPALELLIDYRCGKSIEVGALILRNSSSFHTLFSWDVEGLSPGDRFAAAHPEATSHQSPSLIEREPSNALCGGKTL
jgi:hypothetical protein